MGRKPLNLEKDLLQRLYIDEKKSTYQIAKKLNCGRKTVGKYLSEHNISTRPWNGTGNPSRHCNVGNKHPNWRGGKSNHDGYVFVYCPNHPGAIKGRYIREHRLIMERKLGRYLERWEIVHHLNGIRDDNRIENLELLPRNIDNVAMDSLLRENKRLKEKIKELQKEKRGGGR